MSSIQRPAVVVADHVVDAALMRLAEDSFDVHNLCDSGIHEKRLVEILTRLSAVALIVRSATRVTASALRIASGSGLRVVARAGVGVDNIDCEAAKIYGVLVVNAPEGNTISAVEHTCALMMALARQFPASLFQQPSDWRAIRERVTGDSAPFPITELYGKTLGVIGVGRIGSAVGQRMHAFGMRVLGCDPSFTSSNHVSERPVWLSATLDLNVLLPQIDYLTVHIPLLPQTKGLLNAETLALCRPGFRLINCSRGGIVQESALLSALNSGHCAAAALDVFEHEPLVPSDPVARQLRAHQSVLLTPHVGASSQEAQVRVAIEVADAIRALNASPNIPRCGLEGAVNINSLGKQCRFLFPSWLDSFGPSEAHNPLYLASAVHYMLTQLHADTIFLSHLDKLATLICRITICVPPTTDKWSETKLFLAELIAHVCGKIPKDSDPFYLSSIFLRPDLHRSHSSVEDPVTRAITMTWTTGATVWESICTVLFVHSVSCLEAAERQLFGDDDRPWQLVVSIQSQSAGVIPLTLKTKVGRLMNGHVHLFDDQGVQISEGVSLSCLI